MNFFKNEKLAWLKRLGGVVLVSLMILYIPISIGYYIFDDGIRKSTALLYSALSLFGSYFSVLFVIRIFKYIVFGGSFLKLDFNRKQYSLIISPIILLLIAAGSFWIFVEPIQEKRNAMELKKEYAEAIVLIDSAEQEYRECVEPIVENKFNELMRDCELRIGKVKSDYNFCTSYDSAASCIYTYDYKKIDCSEQTIMNKARLGFYGSCAASKKKLLDLQEVINQYENSEK